MEKEIPAREECFRIMHQYGMLENIIDHSIEVANVALYLSAELNKRGQGIDLLLVEAASLLHDLTKTESFRTKEDHAWTGSQVLKEMGYEKVGEVVAQHIWLSHEVDPIRVSEEEVVNYADKRVMHNRVVSLEERFEDLRKRYGKDPEGVRYLGRMEKLVEAVEQKIFSVLQIDPNDLQDLPWK
ncbi:MAG: HDIG domain-containing metalloprotein [Thermodesulfobacteriota bacterium]